MPVVASLTLAVCPIMEHATARPTCPSAAGMVALSFPRRQRWSGGPQPDQSLRLPSPGEQGVPAPVPDLREWLEAGRLVGRDGADIGTWGAYDRA